MTFDDSMFRRLAFLSLLGGVAVLGGCTDTSRMNVDVFRAETAPVFYQYQPVDQIPPVARRTELYTSSFHQTYGVPVSNPLHMAYYSELRDDDRTLPPIPYRKIDPRYLRQEVSYSTVEPAGTIVIDTRAHFLYLVQSGGKAMRYGVGLGREGYGWTGRGVIQWKQKWPRWTPPEDMVGRQPELRQYAAASGGMNPGLANPLGARAMYIFKDGQDTLYRIHGTPDWKSIGKATSSGCVRMLNQDVIDLYERVPAKTRVVVM